jgi:hypothetical protein
MASYEAFDQNIKIDGQVVYAVVEEAMGRFSDTYREQALTALTEEGIDDPSSGE